MGDKLMYDTFIMKRAKKYIDKLPVKEKRIIDYVEKILINSPGFILFRRQAGVARLPPFP